MSSLKDIVRRNSETFYDFGTGRRYSILPRLISFVILSFVLSLIFSDLDAQVLSAIITVQAILIGFSFSVIFFLVSSPGVSGDAQSKSIEKSVKAERLVRLSNELFHNVSYFNLVGIACVISAVILMLPKIETIEIVVGVYRNAVASIPEGMPGHSYVKGFYWFAGLVSEALFVFMLLESIYTFVRVVKRVNFFFSERIDLMSRRTSAH